MRICFCIDCAWPSYSPLGETIQILDNFLIISDLSGHLFPDWIWESFLPANHRCMNATLLNGREIQGGSEKRGRERFFQLLNLKILKCLLITLCLHQVLGAGRGQDILLKHASKYAVDLSEPTQNLSAGNQKPNHCTILPILT